MGHRATARRVLAGLLVASVCLGSPLVTFAETRTQTFQVVIHIPPRRTTAPLSTATAQPPAADAGAEAREAAIRDAVARLVLRKAYAQLRSE